MKILSSILIAVVALPLGVSMGAGYIPDIKSAIPYNIYAISDLVSNNLNSEPAIMILIGMGLITIAGFGRKRLIRKDKDSNQRDDFRSTIPPHPDPVPWKKD
jgi:hypothetical protein